MSYKLPFVGIVDRIIDIESEEKQVSPKNDLVDNRYRVWVKPLEDMGILTNVECFFSNYSSMDLPLPNEAVLIIPTNIGNVIVDKLTTNASNLNFDPKTPLLGGTLSNINNLQTIPLEKRQTKYINKVRLEDQPPFMCKVGAKYELGRNGQYLIFDSKKRINSTLESEGDFVKVGIRTDENEEDSFEDNHIFIAKNENIKRFMQVSMDSKYTPSNEDMGNGGVGSVGDNIMLYGKRFMVLFSRENLILRSYKKILLHATEEVKLESDRINIGDGADTPIVRGEELVKMINDLVSIIESLQTGIIINPATMTSNAFTPNIPIKLELLKRKYLNDKSPMLSKKGFIE
jgi:hypothetical protein